MEPFILRLEDFMKEGALPPNDRSDVLYPLLLWRSQHVDANISFTGGLSISFRSMMMNWMYNHLLDIKKDQFKTWRTDGTLHAALMLWIAVRYKDELVGADGAVNEVLYARAWEHLVEFTGRTIDGREVPAVEDVDKIRLASFERLLFDESKEAGAAGQRQWGLDTDGHQENWDPYTSI